MLRFENHVLTKVILVASNIVVLSLPLNATATSSNGLLVKAQTLMEQDKDEAALACLNSLLKLEPKNAKAYGERSRVYFRLSKNDDALADSNKAISIDPKLAGAFVARAGIYAETGRFQNALDDCNKAVALKPRLADAYSMRAYTYARLKQYQKQLENCNTAIAIEPRSGKRYFLRAEAYTNLKQYQKVLQDCDFALQFGSKGASTYTTRGNAFYRLEKFQRAVEDCNIAIKISPHHRYAYELRAGAYGKLGQFQKQIDDLTSAIKINPKVADLYERRSYVHKRVGRLQDVIDDCASVLSLDPTSSYACSTAAEANEALGFYEKAIELRTKGLGFDKNDAFVWNSRANDYEFLGKPNLSQSDRKKANELASPTQRLTLQQCNPLINFNNVSVEGPINIIGKQLKNKSIILSFDYDDGAHIGVPVQINDHPLRFMLDTGCGHTELWKQALPAVAKVDIVKVRRSKANGKGYSFGFFRAQNLKLGDLTLPKVAIAVDDGLVGHKTLSGFLGGNILENLVVTIDYSKKQIILAASSEQEKSHKAIVVPMWISSHKPYCGIKLDGKLQLPALLDTGCPFSMSADLLLKPILTKKLIFKDHISGPWLGSLSSESVRLKSLGLGASNFDPPLFDVFPAAEAPVAASAITLGNDFLSRFKTVTFDYPGRRVLFEPK